MITHPKTMLWNLKSPAEDETAVQSCGTITRVNTLQLNTALRDSVLEVGPFKVTVSDLLTTLTPGTLSTKETQKIKQQIPAFVDGWLTDTIIDATLWQLTKRDPKVFAADSTLCQVVRHGASTRRLWMGQKFNGIEKIFIPVNIAGNHWTLLVLDYKETTRIYIDPFHGNKHADEITATSNRGLHKLINDLSEAADMKTGWKSKEWKCIEPPHFKQTDGFNCGVLVCTFARNLCGNKPITNVNVSIERKKILASLFGSCYDDISRRATLVCKVCRMDDNEDWLGCDKCGQFFHASCLGLNFANALQETFFYCP